MVHAFRIQDDSILPRGISWVVGGIGKNILMATRMFSGCSISVEPISTFED
jgi:hypothetical protein